MTRIAIGKSYVTREGAVVDVFARDGAFGKFHGRFRGSTQTEKYWDNGYVSGNEERPNDLVREYVVERPDPNQPVIIRTLVQRDYVFHTGAIDGRTVDDLIDEFFTKYPAGSYHAARDGAHVGGADKLIEVRQITSDKLGYKLGGFKA